MTEKEAKSLKNTIAKAYIYRTGTTEWVSKEQVFKAIDALVTKGVMGK